MSVSPPPRTTLPIPAAAAALSPRPQQTTAAAPAGYLWAILITATATAMGWPLYHGFHLPADSRKPHLANTNVLMLYLLGVLWISTRYTRRAAILASILGVAAFDICFVPPYLSVDVADRQYLITFAVMLLTALIISTLTHRLRAQSAAAQQVWERAEAEFLRNTLLSSVSHDLRTPIASILGAATTLAERHEHLPPPARAQMLDTISTEAERMERLINNLLDMTRFESGGLVLHKEWQHIGEVVGSALRHVRRRSRTHPLSTRIPPDMPLIQIDAIAIEQVLVNLLDNALEHTSPGTPIEIEVTTSDLQVILEVADRGPGLPAGTNHRVFDKFFRAPSPAARSRAGLGLGLAICQGIVDAHSGAITAHNRPGGGAVFRIELPRIGTIPVIDETE